MDKLVVENLSYYYGRSVGLRRLSFHLDKGQVVAVVGPNGAGKSTLLNLLSGCLLASSGTVEYGDMLIQGGGQKLGVRVLRLIGAQLSKSFMYPDLSVRENLMFYAQLQLLINPTERVGEVVKEFGLNDFLDKRFADCSMGMAKRVAVARAVLHNPELLIFDEPFTALDVEGKQQLLRLMMQARDANRIVIFSSHDQAIIDQIADTVLVLSRGRLDRMAQNRRTK